jgi:hypothetical protein
MQPNESKRKIWEDGDYYITNLTLAAIGGRFSSQWISNTYNLDYTKDNQGEVTNAKRINPAPFFYIDTWFMNLAALTAANGQGIYVNYTYQIGDRINALNTITAPNTGWIDDFQNMAGLCPSLPIVDDLTNNINRIKIFGERFVRIQADFFFAVNAVAPIWAFRLTRGIA